MSVNTEEVTAETAHVCSNCEAKVTSAEVALPKGWVEVRIRSGAGIHLDSTVCDECAADIRKALSGRRPKAEVKTEAKAEAPAPKQTSRRRKADADAEAQAATEAEADKNAAESRQEAPADAAPIEEVHPADTPPVTEEAAK